MATQLTVEEAELIARETGAKLTMPKRFNDVEAIRAKYTGVACTFLTPKGCSIYAQRPYSCRVVFSIDRDETLCAIVPGEIINTPSLNYRAYNDVFVEVFDGRLLYADIREFFVPRTGKKE
jgi:Fe-S-cluster containining protein